MIPLALLPISDLVDLQSMEREEGRFLLALKMKCTHDFCPDCGEKSTNRHSIYMRKLMDLPWAGIPVRVNLQVYKYYCKNENCHRKIFAQRMGEKIKPYARRTHRLTEHLNQISFALGGNAGSKLAAFLGMPVSSSTLLRVILKSDDHPVSIPRVMGVDDWAFRKGQTYGTILVDLEKRKPIDLLPDREASTLKDWLKSHPGVEIISRDRSSAYSSGAKAGAPDAIQVADRWHLLKNLSEALKKMLDAHNRELRLAAKDIAQAERDQEAKIDKGKQNEKATEKPHRSNKKTNTTLSKYHLIFLEVKKLWAQGHSIKAIRRQTGLHRQTIKRYLKYDKYPEPAPATTYSTEIRDYEDHIQKRWKEGERNGKQLWREIQEQGFSGSFQSLYRLIKKYPRDPDKEELPPPLKIKAWSAKKVSLLIGQDFDILEEKERNYLRAFIKYCPKAKEANSLALQFKEMTDKLKVSLLDKWIEKAKNSGIGALKNYAAGLEQDYDAVKAAVSLTWSNGQVEGQINRLKNIKRQMYGRASFELLRKRVLMDSS